MHAARIALGLGIALVLSGCACAPAQGEPQDVRTSSAHPPAASPPRLNPQGELRDGSASAQREVREVRASNAHPPAASPPRLNPQGELRDGSASAQREVRDARAPNAHPPAASRHGSDLRDGTREHSAPAQQPETPRPRGEPDPTTAPAGAASVAMATAARPELAPRRAIARPRVEALARELEIAPPAQIARSSSPEGQLVFGAGGQSLTASAPFRAAELALPEPDAEQRELAAALVQTLAGSDARMRRAALEDARHLGLPGLALYLQRLSDAQASPAQREAAAELARLFDSPACAARLIELCERAPDAQQRALAARGLGAQGGQDWCVPRLVLRLKYETDHAAAAWTAWALAQHGNWAGLDALAMIAASPSSPAAAELVQQLSEQLAAQAGARELADVRARWNSPAATQPPRARGARYELEVWARIDALGAWQLRDVDDARFTLARLGPECVPWIASALRESDRRVRTHIAQCLERAGARARAASDALLAELDDAELGPLAAQALAGIGAESAEPALRARLGAQQPIELRVAAARALAQLARPASAAALEPLIDAREPPELRQAAAEALIACAESRAALELLLECLERQTGDPGRAERALGAWLHAHPPSEPALTAAWDALDTSGGAIPSAEALRVRRLARAALLRAGLRER